jgi:hypothetical protein
MIASVISVLDPRRVRCAQELSQEPAIDAFKMGMELGNQMRAMAEEELVRMNADTCMKAWIPFSQARMPSRSRGCGA